jgi:hypothetical protein
MQSTTPKHVKRRPKKGRVSWKEPIEVTTIIRGDFQGINRAEQKLRRGTTVERKTTPEKMEINHATAPYLGINPIAHKSQVRSDRGQTATTTTAHGSQVTIWRTPMFMEKHSRDGLEARH